MTTVAVQIQDRGVITLPKKLRDRWGLAKGDFLNVSIADDAEEAVMQPVATINKDILRASQKALKELRAGKSSGAFSSMDDFERSLGLR